MAEINRENVAKWVAALRSGEFRQAAGALRKKSGFCCLGVACEVYRRETGQGVWDPNTGETDGTTAFEECLTDPELHRAATEYEMLPKPVKDWLGLDDSDPALDEHDTHPESPQWRSAATLNDAGVPFDAIAGFIERQLLGAQR